MCPRILSLFVLLGISAAAATDPGRGTGEPAPTAALLQRLRGALILNEDNSHFFSSRPPEAMTLEGLRAWVDGYAGSKVTHLFLCPNAMRASFRSRTREAIWDPVAGLEPDGRWPQNAKRLHNAGLDPYAIWIARAREKNLSPWLSMRMNDVHGVDNPESFMHSSFWRQHPEMRRVPGGPTTPWVNHALNYTHAAVREHQLAFVRELLERYDPDGLELDWMRFGHHLTPGHEREEAGKLDDFVREVRELTAHHGRRRGHPLLLGVRVPADPDAAAGLGLDALRWARAGLVDLIVTGPFFSTSDFDIPLERWRDRLGPDLARVVLAPALEHNSRAWPTATTVPNDLAVARGFAASAWSRGADSLYLFNWMDSETRPVSAADYARLLREGLAADVAGAAPRRHPSTYRDTVPAGFSQQAQLPVEATAGGSFRLHIGPRPTTGRAALICGLAPRDQAAAATFAATANGRPLPPPEELRDRRGVGGTAYALRFPCPPAALRDGYNDFTLRQVGGPTAQQIVWVELRVDVE